eukprot:5172608-Amphidinium_carterae.1
MKALPGLRASIHSLASRGHLTFPASIHQCQTLAASPPWTISSRVADLRRPAPFPSVVSSARLALAQSLAVPCAGMPPTSAA